MSDKDYAELLALRKENKGLRKQLQETIESNKQIGQQLKDSLNGNKELSQQLKDLQGKLDILITQINKRNQRDYGPKTERHNPKPALSITDATAAKPPEKPVARNHEKHILTQQLPPEPVHHSVSSEELLCPTCIVETVVFDHEVTYQLEKLNQTLKLLEHRAEVRSCPKCKQYVVTAQKPIPPIPGSYAGPALLANIVTEKFDDALPLNRQQKKFAREKAIIPRSTQSDWVIETASTIAPLYALLKKDVLSSKCVKTDDSEIKIQDRKYKGKMRKGKMSVYLGDKYHKSTVFDFSPNKSFAKNKEFLKDFKGYVQADAANGFDALFQDDSKIELGCNAHARRRFFECLTVETETCNDILNIYGELYGIEKDIKNKTSEERLLARQTKSQPLINTLHLKLVALKDTLNPTNPLMEAVSYALNHWLALARCLDDPDFDIDNNTSEQAIKSFVLMRKNSLFVGSDAGGMAAAVHLSFIASCKRNNINPVEYLTDVFTRINSMKTSELEQLLPHRWTEIQKSKSHNSS
ncbi:MAG TPA: IS66 family transposase [Rhabdochlamydiaceae bacterium]